MPISFKMVFLLKLKFGRLFVNDGDRGPEAWGQKRAEAERTAYFERHHAAAEAKHISSLSKGFQIPAAGPLSLESFGFEGQSLFHHPACSTALPSLMAAPTVREEMKMKA